MSVSQFWLLVIGVQVSTSRMPYFFKGAGVEWIAKQMLRDVRKCGYHGRVVFRTDGELAILDLMGEVARLRGDLRTVLEHGAPLGTARVMVLWRGQFDQLRT